MAITQFSDRSAAGTLNRYYTLADASISFTPVVTAEAGEPGVLYATGVNAEGQLGIGNYDSKTEFTYAGTLEFTALSSAYRHCLGIAAGKLYSWGWNSVGQLGLNDTDSRATPTQVGSATDWVAVSAGKLHSTAINKKGELYAWGQNSDGQLGIGNTTIKYVPTRVGTSAGWATVSAGVRHTMAINRFGQIFSCGFNENGELGLGDKTPRNVLTRVGIASNWVSIATHQFQSCAINNAGELYYCGYSNDFTTQLTELTRIGSASNWVSISSSIKTHGMGQNNGHQFAINSLGELYSWGYNGSGQLGLGDTTMRTSPTKIGSSTDWVMARAGGDHSVAINTSGEVYTWGKYNSGQLGQGSGNITTPTKVGLLTGYTLCAAGEAYTIVALATS
jgi:alpha-tubulin suppressor-like RCC1 family protein